MRRLLLFLLLPTLFLLPYPARAQQPPVGAGKFKIQRVKPRQHVAQIVVQRTVAALIAAANCMVPGGKVLRLHKEHEIIALNKISHQCGIRFQHR